MKLLNDLGIKVKDKELYLTALTHTSFANEHNCESYERLEYLGDAVLEVLMSEYLYKLNKYNEGEMTKLRAHYVCEDALFEYSNILHLSEHIRLGKGEEQGVCSKAIIADVFEALIGAIYLDLGFMAAKKFFNDKVIPLIESDKIVVEDDFKSHLQELMQTERRTLEYKIIAEEGPPHDKTFTAIVKIDDITYGTGVAHSKKEAEQLAAKDALTKAQTN